MVKPQQPELRRSDRGATSDDAAKPRLSAPNGPGADSPGGRGIPEDNLPGHHPDHEQDKPSGQDFVAKTHALAESENYEAPSPENEVLDLTQVVTDGVHHTPSPVERAVSLAGKSLSITGKSIGFGFNVAGTVLGEVRKRLPRR
jgi:hypothetical protein